MTTRCSVCGAAVTGTLPRPRALSIGLALTALLAGCDAPSRAIVRSADGGAAADVVNVRMGAPEAGDCARNNGGCSAYAQCLPAGPGRRQCVCAPGLRVQADQRACEGLLLVSVARDGRAGGASSAPRIAARGRYVVFASEAADLPYDRPVPAATPAPQHCYLRDVVTGRTVLVSADARGALPSTPIGCSSPQVSADGRLVAFLHADVIAPDDRPVHPVPNVYVRPVSGDLAVGAPRRIRFDAARPLDRESSAMYMSRDGRRFALATRSALAGEADNEHDVFVYTEGAAPAVVAASVDSTGRIPSFGAACGGNARPAGFSGDGEHLGFNSVRRYVSGDNDEVLDPHVRSLTEPRTELLTPSLSGTGPRATCAYVGAGLALSYDGRFALFYSDNARFDAALSPGNPDVFLRDRDVPVGEPGRFTRLRVAPMPDPGGQFNEGVALSDDGRFAVVPSRRRLDLPAGAALRLSPDLYLLDLSDLSDPLRGARLLDVDERGEPSDSGAVPFEPSITADGSAVSFVARTPLVPEDTNELPDVYLRVLR
jgi:hypothetical protein